MLNPLDVQARVKELALDVFNAIACEIADWEYDRYLANDDMDLELVDEHIRYIDRLEKLKVELEWYESIKFRHNHRRA